MELEYIRNNVFFFVFHPFLLIFSTRSATEKSSITIVTTSEKKVL